MPEPEGTDDEDAPEIPNAADRTSQRRIRDRVKRERAEAVDFYKAIFASPVGRREMWGILTAMHAFDQRFASAPNGFPQESATWFYLGERDAGFRLFRSWMRLDPEGVTKMMREHDPVLAELPKRPRRKKEE
jgi:hypothetical protein